MKLGQSECRCVCMCVSAHVSVCRHVCVCIIHRCVTAHLHMCAHENIWTCVHVHAYIYSMCMCVHICVCVHLCSESGRWSREKVQNNTEIGVISNMFNTNIVKPEQLVQVQSQLISLGQSPEGTMLSQALTI